jgi:hypothetical protein
MEVQPLIEIYPSNVNEYPWKSQSIMGKILWFRDVGMYHASFRQVSVHDNVPLMRVVDKCLEMFVSSGLPREDYVNTGPRR